MKSMLKKVGLLALGAVGFVTNANAALTAPDFSSVITDMGTAFTAILTLVVAFLGFKYIRKMFAA
ncbi:MAG: hypothetical protein PHZ17_03390 [Sulfurovum sp.]|nr:hypothetical protein [Sulfurovum sp.]